jgi:hypothetical protein
MAVSTTRSRVPTTAPDIDKQDCDVKQEPRAWTLLDGAETPVYRQLAPTGRSRKGNGQPRFHHPRGDRRRHPRIALRPSSYRSSPLFVLPEYEGHGTELAWLAVSPDTRAARFYMRRNWTQPAQIPAARSASSPAAPRSPTPRISRPDAARSRMRRMGMVDDSESCGPGESYHRQSRFQCAGVC